MQSFKDIIDRWPSRAALAGDVGISDVLARAWHQRNSIPASKWALVVTAARGRGFSDVTYDLLVRCAASRRKDADAA